MSQRNTRQAKERRRQEREYRAVKSSRRLVGAEPDTTAAVPAVGSIAKAAEDVCLLTLLALGRPAMAEELQAASTGDHDIAAAYAAYMPAPFQREALDGAMKALQTFGE